MAQVKEAPSTTSRALKTGQTRCWSASGALVNCMGTGQDGEIQAGLPSPTPRFVDNENGTVTDQLTGLIWLKDANRFGEVTWMQGLTICNTLTGGSFGLTDGSVAGDWRLPNVNELQSLLEFNNSSGPAITTDNPFANLHAANYWSSTSVAAFPALGWYVALAVGCPVFDLKFNAMRIWPVRGASTCVARTGQKKCYDVLGHEIPCAGTGQDGAIRAGVPWPEPRFTDNKDGTVTDNLTALIWLKNGNPFGTRSWEHALKDCNALASGHYGLTDGSVAGDWRMPNINELRALEDYNEHTPALPAGHPFTNVRQSLCWASTTVPTAPTLARFLFVGIGSAVWDHKGVIMGVWPVRGGRKAQQPRY
ncbi:MAG TPA: DUF1566 domain-containing protein [Thermoanaerobaculia bacterium]|nr:DUF1566 domain-containing protein [Thermoanaerobaculia bacterium]